MAEEIATSDPKPRKRREQLTSVQVLFAAILAIGLALAISLSSRILAGQPLDEAYKRVLSEIDQLKHEQADLIAERDYVRSRCGCNQRTAGRTLSGFACRQPGPG